MHPPLNVEGMAFHPVMHLPDELEIYDFTAGYNPDRTLTHSPGPLGLASLR